LDALIASTVGRNWLVQSMRPPATSATAENSPRRRNSPDEPADTVLIAVLLTALAAHGCASLWNALRMDPCMIVEEGKMWDEETALMHVVQNAHQQG